MPRARSLLPLVLLVAGCATYQDELQRGQKAFESNSYERALAHFRPLARELDHLAPQERAQYAYLRGMTDYRVGYRADARYWLGLAQAIDEKAPGALPEAWKSKLTPLLATMSEEVYDRGYASLAKPPEKKAATKAAGARNDSE